MRSIRILDGSNKIVSTSFVLCDVIFFFIFLDVKEVRKDDNFFKIK